MNKLLAILLTVLLCVCFAACTAEPNVPTTEPTEQTTEAPAPESTAAPTVEFENPTIGGNVTPPVDMPDPPENDYSLPPGEHPGEQGEIIDK